MIQTLKNKWASLPKKWKIAAAAVVAVIVLILIS